jgi:hypothetical protein
MKNSGEQRHPHWQLDAVNSMWDVRFLDLEIQHPKAPGKDKKPPGKNNLS